MNVGVDLIEIGRIRRALERYPGFRERCFTEAEQSYGADRVRRLESLAGRFAAKEAIFKALGTGWRDGIAWTDIEVKLLPSGAPTLKVGGRAGEIAADLGITGWLISLSHTDTHAIASVIGLGQTQPEPPPSP